MPESLLPSKHYIVYTLNGAIKDFFEAHPGVTQQQCNALAISLLGEPSTPAPCQGNCSYTVFAGPDQAMVVQFRSPGAVLDLEVLSRAREIHGQLVPTCVYHGTIGDEPSALPVYVMEKFPGITYVLAMTIYGLSTKVSSEAASRQENTTKGLARFFAQSWNHPQAKPQEEVNTMHRECEQKLDILLQGLPSRFKRTIREARAGLPLIFTPSYPLVLGHDDLNESNLCVDAKNGNLTGVTDWVDAKILPFGLNLWGFENILGWQDHNGWHYYDNYHKLEALFWETFKCEVGALLESQKKAMRVARMVGFLLRYGLLWEDGVGLVPIKEGYSSLKYLETFCTGDNRTSEPK